MKLKKLGVTLLAMLLALCMLASCGVNLGEKPSRNDDDDETTVTTTDDDDSNPSKPPKTQAETLKLFTNGASSYRIVYPIGRTEWEYKLAQDLQAAIKQITGVTLPMVNDFEFEYEPHTVRQDKEILIGDTSRNDEYNVIPADDIKLGYNMFVCYDRVVILANSHVGAYQALRQFILDQFGYDLDNYDKDVTKLPTKSNANVTVHHTYFKKATVASDYFANLEVMLGDVVIKHDSSSLQHRVAYQVRDAIKDATGIILPVTNQKPADGTPVIKFLTDLTLEKGCWKIVSNENNEITVKANGYYGFYDAATYFKSALKTDGYYDFEKEPSGDYVDHASGQATATKYAYDQRGDLRVMFLNVLFGTVDPESRNPLQAYMMDAYRPDVLGGQEFNNTKRGGSKDLEGDGGLVALLADLGYVEAVDPRVHNAYGTGELIPGTEDWAYLTNPIYQQGQKHHGYGGGTTVTYNGETYNTFFNNTPLFYNSETTELIAAEYYWYKSQWDRITGANHENSAMDCGSKAATWGVFKDKATGEQYIVISTHMCTRSNYIRGLQGQEIVALIQKLVNQYQCPVFFGGDMNGNIGDANYDLFIESGYLSLQDSLIGGKHVASEFTSDLRTNQPYPIFNTELRIMTPAPGASVATTAQVTNQNSIDQIFVIDNRVLENAKKEVDVKTFCVVVDDVVMSSSDHLPIFTDFSFRN
ncbi:MAG: hypothetical protein IJW16_06465 [Clostridia bacterium]|nr:hypothetical protein [Clostridia bacterium]